MNCEGKSHKCNNRNEELYAAHRGDAKDLDCKLSLLVAKSASPRKKKLKGLQARAEITKRDLSETEENVRTNKI